MTIACIQLCFPQALNKPILFIIEASLGSNPLISHANLANLGTDGDMAGRSVAVPSFPPGSGFDMSAWPSGSLHSLVRLHVSS